MFNFVRRSLSARAVGDVVLKMREDAFDAVLKRDMSFYDEFASGKIVSRVTSDTQAFSQVVVLAMDLISQLLLVVLLLPRFSVAFVPAQAATQAELEAQINSLLATIAALQAQMGGSVSTSSVWRAAGSRSNTLPISSLIRSSMVIAPPWYLQAQTGPNELAARPGSR